MIQELYKKYNVSKLYAYVEKPGDNRVIECGWVPADALPDKADLVISMRDDENNAATLDDYRKYFGRLTFLTPNEFISKWENNKDALSLYWKSRFPNAKEGDHIFMLKVARLIRDRESFDMHGAVFEVVSSK